MMDRRQLADLTRRVLLGMGLYSREAMWLLLGTAAQESGLGRYVRQLGGGPALGIFQMEPGTFEDIVRHVLGRRLELRRRLMKVAGVDGLRSGDLEFNLALAIGMARLHYWRVAEPIPGDLPGWARYWKRYYNTPAGKGTVEEFEGNFRRLLGTADGEEVEV